jgi:hypothetical protein
MSKLESSGGSGGSSGEEKRRTEVESARSRPADYVGRNRLRALEPERRNRAVGAEHALGEETVGPAALKVRHIVRKGWRNERRLRTLD